MNKMSKETGRYLALFILVSILMLAITVSYRIYADYISEKQFSANKLEKIRKKLDYISKNKTRINEMYQAYKNNRSINELYLNKKNPEKELVAHIKYINKTSCRLDEHETVKAATDEATINIKYKTSCNYNDLYDLFFVLDNSKPLIAIDKVEIFRVKDAAAKNTMAAEFVVKGYVKG